MTVTFYLNDELTRGTSVYQQDEGMKYNVRIQPHPHIHVKDNFMSMMAGLRIPIPIPIQTAIQMATL